MSKKSLLNESQVRHFMKLAKLEPLAPGFIEGLDESHGRGRREGAAGYGHIDQNTRLEEDEASPGALEDYALGDVERDEPGEAAEDELGAAEEEGEGVEPEGELLSKAEILSVFEKALEDLFPEEEVEVVDDEDDAGAEAEFEPEGTSVVADVEASAEEELQEGEGDEEELDEGDEDIDDIVEQITKRVAARILKSALVKK